jgi:Family of unknown function (DUF6496)
MNSQAAPPPLVAILLVARLHPIHKGKTMPEKTTLKRVEEDKREGKSPSTQAGEFVREEMDHIREGKHGARSAKQAIAIGLSKARRAGVDLKPPKKGRASEKTRKSAERDYRKAHSATKKSPSSSKRSSARLKALKREPRSAASHIALSRQAKSAAKRRKRSGPATSGGRTHRKAA